MKKLLFSLVATAACGAVSAAVEDFSQYTLGAEFSAATNTSGEVSSSNPGYWTINMSETPEMLITNNVTDTTDKYLQINTGSTPLWRTFEPVTSVADATSGNPTTSAVGDVTLVQSDVKLTACTEFPNIPDDFVNEKLAIFLYAPEDDAAAALHPGGLYAVGGKIVDSALVATAYRLNVAANAITNNEGWATIAIKSYADVMSNNTGNEKYPGFVIAVAPKGSQVIPVVSVVEDDYAPGFNTGDLTSAAATRIGNRTLIPSAKTSVSSEDYPKGTLLGLGFQGEGGIDNVNLAANDFAADAAMMTVNIKGAAELEVVTGGTLADGKVTFTPGATVTFKVKSTADIVKVTYSGKNALSYDENTKVYSVVAEAEATITVSASAAAFQIGDAKYATLADALDGLTSGSTLKLLSACDVGANSLTLSTAGTYTLDLNGQVISGSSARGVVMVNANVALTITNSNTTVEGGIANTAGAAGCAIANNGTLLLQAGKYTGSIVGAATITGGKFNPKPGNNASIGDKQWSEADTYGYYTLVEDAGEGDDTEGPSVGEGEGSVTVDETSGDATVAPAEGKTEVTITLPTGFTGNVIVPSSLDKIVGVPAGKLVIKSGSFDVTGAFSYDATTGAIALDEAGSVTIDDEEIPVKPALADGTDETPFEVGASGPEANVKAIPGLTYELILSDSVNGTYGSIVEGGDKTKVKATGKRVNLKDGRANRGAKGFYKVQVTK